MVHSNTWNHLTLLTYAKLLEIDLFDHLTLYQQNVFPNHIFNIYVKQNLSLNN